jgi:hypothetical protein
VAAAWGELACPCGVAPPFLSAGDDVPAMEHAPFGEDKAEEKRWEGARECDTGGRGYVTFLPL